MTRLYKEQPSVCGIAGILAPQGRLDPDVINTMVSAQRHRGPDDAGVQRIPAGEAECWLGSVRLAIIDLSPAGHMPMADPQSGNVIVYNGEIYNFLAIRRELEARGEFFTSRTDTEVILRLYRHEGTSCVSRLRGMFAFAIWDAQRQELFLARDRVGKKPLYYAATPGAFLFASEVRALLTSGLVPRRLDPETLQVYLANGFVVSPLSMIRNVYSLLPGHWMRVAADGTILERGCYWAPPRPEPAARVQPDDLLEQLRSTLQEAVALRLISDVPLGVFLSGGLDSSAMVAMLRQNGSDVRTFSIGFPEAEFDESPFSRRVAAHFDTRHTEYQLSQEEFWQWLPQALAAMDQPTFDGINSYYVSRAAAAAGLKVALSGIGADELFGGYPFFRSVPSMSRAAAVAGALPRATGPFVQGVLARGAATDRVAGPWKLLELLSAGPAAQAGGAGPLMAAYQAAQTLFPSWARAALTADPPPRGPGIPAGHALGLPAAFAAFLQRDLAGQDRLGGLSLLTWRLFLGERCLRDTDSMSMGVSLETRAPFTDHVFVEHVMRIRGVARCAGAPGKPYEWRLVEPYLGEALPHRPKQGFIFPFRRWLGQPAGVSFVGDVAQDRDLLRSIGLRPEAVAHVWDRFRADPDRVPWSRVWSILALATWCRRMQVTL